MPCKSFDLDPVRSPTSANITFDSRSLTDWRSAELHNVGDNNKKDCSHTKYVVLMLFINN